MTKFKYLFLFLFVGVFIVLLLVPRKGFFKPIDQGVRIRVFKDKRHLSYIQVLLLLSGLISLSVLLLVRYIMS